jgi:hypothetical protein
MSFNMDDYVPVVDRLAEAYTRWPELRLYEHPATVINIDGHAFVASTVTAHRSPEDTHPAQAPAWEPFPGKTSFTRESEMMNAATSAVGRVLALMGVAAKKSIASRDEVRNRQTQGGDNARQVRAQNAPRRSDPVPDGEPWDMEPPPYEGPPPSDASEQPHSTHMPPGDNLASSKQIGFLNVLLKKAGKPPVGPMTITKQAASRMIEELNADGGR